jgi:putative sigma-54 modulation protein
MEIQITARNLGTGGATESIKNYIHKKFPKLKRYFHQITNIHITLYIEREKHISEILISGDGLTFFAKESSQDMYASLDLLYDNIERQIRRHKEKITFHKSSSNKDVAITYEEENKEKPFSFKHKDIFYEDKPMDEIEAILQFELNNKPCIAFIKPKEIAENEGVFYYLTREDNHYCIYHLEKDDKEVFVIAR